MGSMECSVDAVFHRAKPACFGCIGLPDVGIFFEGLLLFLRIEAFFFRNLQLFTGLSYAHSVYLKDRSDFFKGRIGVFSHIRDKCLIINLSLLVFTSLARWKRRLLTMLAKPTV